MLRRSQILRASAAPREFKKVLLVTCLPARSDDCEDFFHYFLTHAKMRRRGVFMLRRSLILRASAAPREIRMMSSTLTFIFFASFVFFAA